MQPVSGGLNSSLVWAEPAPETLDLEVTYPLGLVGEPRHVFRDTGTRVQETVAALQSEAGPGPTPSDSVYRPRHHTCSNRSPGTGEDTGGMKMRRAHKPPGETETRETLHLSEPDAHRVVS